MYFTSVFFPREYQSHSTLIYQTTTPNLYKPTPVHTQYSIYKQQQLQQQQHSMSSSSYNNSGKEAAGAIFKDNIYDVPYSNTKYKPVSTCDVREGIFDVINDGARDVRDAQPPLDFSSARLALRETRLSNSGGGSGFRDMIIRPGPPPVRFGSPAAAGETARNSCDRTSSSHSNSNNTSNSSTSRSSSANRAGKGVKSRGKASQASPISTLINETKNLHYPTK